MIGRAMKVLVACEFSGTVRNAFLSRGHDAWSCDLLPTETMPERHIQGDCVDAINRGAWDVIIIHIPCTQMAVCGNKTYGANGARHGERQRAIEWSISVWDAACAVSNHVAMENPASVLFPALRDMRGADVQYVQPWQFGHPEQKKTGLALRGLPRLKPTRDVHAAMMALPRCQRERIFFMSPGKDRQRERSRFFKGIAEAMADQWGGYAMEAMAA